MNIQSLNTKFISHAYPQAFPRHAGITASVNGVALDILLSGNIGFASCQAEGLVRVELTFSERKDSVKVSPARYGIQADLSEDGCRASFSWKCPGKIQIKIGNLPEIYFSAGTIERPEGFSEKECTHTYRAGEVHSVGMLTPQSGDVIWIEGGGSPSRGNLFEGRGKLPYRRAWDFVL